MSHAWEVLEEAGVPTGPPRPARAILDDPRLRCALEELAGHPDAVAPALREPLLAWLNALSRHWPSRFDAVTGTGGRALLASLSAMPVDANRVLKLRRIAIDNLARSL
jgi:hypothetical protein